MIDLAAIGQIATIQVDAGRSLRYLKSGSGEPLILLHTIRTQLDYFHEAMPALAEKYTVYALDLPGYGYSSIDTRANYDEPYLRSAVVAFINKLGLGNVTLAGESIGAVLANWRSWRDARMLYAGVRAPVTLVYGSHDWSTLEERKSTAAALGGIPIMTVNDTGHFGFVDRPQRMAEIVLAHQGG